MLSICVLFAIRQTDLLAMYRASQSSHEESELNLSAAQYVNFDQHSAVEIVLGKVQCTGLVAKCNHVNIQITLIRI